MALSEICLTIGQISSFLHRSKDSTRKLVKKEIGFIRDGKQMLIRETDFKEYLNSNYIRKRQNV